MTEPPTPRHTSNDPLHGVTLEMLLTRLVERYGWDELGKRVKIACFRSDPSIASSLKFLRRMPWARKKVEALYLAGLRVNAGSGHSRRSIGRRAPPGGSASNT